MLKIDNFPYSLLFRLKFEGVPFTIDLSVMLGSAERENVRLISCEIIFAEFQPI